MCSMSRRLDDMEQDLQSAVSRLNDLRQVSRRAIEDFQKQTAAMLNATIANMMAQLFEQDNEMVQEITGLSRETTDLFQEIAVLQAHLQDGKLHMRKWMESWAE